MILKIKITAIFFSIILASVIILTLYKIEYNKGDYHKTDAFAAMDTSVSVTLWGKHSDNEIYNSIKSKIKELDGIFDAYSESGEIYKLNKSRSLECSNYAADIISKTLALQGKYKNVDISSGDLIFLWDFQSENPRVPSYEEVSESLKTVNSDNISVNGNEIVLKNNTKIDLSSVAKGYACDTVREELRKTDVDCAVISFGSSTLLYGLKPNGNEFSVAVRSPQGDSKAYVGKLKTKSCAISSSGGYERYFQADGKIYSHILDLNTGYPAETDLTSVTVVSQNGLLTDFLSTEIYIGGTKNIGSYLNEEGYSVIALSDDNKIYISDDIKDSFEITDNKYSFK